MLLSDPLTVIGIFMLGAGSGALLTYARAGQALGECRKALQLSSVNAPPNGAEVPDLGIKAVVAGQDRQMVLIFSHLLHEMNVETHKCLTASDALDQFSCNKFDALVLDVDKVPGCAEIAEDLRATPSNRHAVVIAVASDNRARNIASELGAFIVERPLVPSQIRSLLRVTHARMLVGRMAYFRLAAEFPVSVRRRSGELLQCTSINLSESGMAISTPSPLEAGEPLTVVFAIPNAELVISGEGNVIWDDKHGKAGIHFECASSSVKARYSGWLRNQFFCKAHSSNTADEISQHFAVTH